MKRNESFDTYECIDPGTPWGTFFDGAFQSNLDYGYLPEGSRWLRRKTGQIFVVVGKGAPLSSDYDDKYPQELRRVNGHNTRRSRD